MTAKVSLGDLAAASRTFTEAESLACRHGSSRYIARAHEGLAHVALASGDDEVARKEWEIALSLVPPDVFDAQDVRRHLDGLGSTGPTCRRCALAADRSESAPG
jgi:ATP/maltotriose-dependent transcriptional regulator MalT